MSVQQVPAGYKFVWQVIDGQQVQVLVPDLDSAVSIYNEVPEPYPWKHPVANVYELQSLLRETCDEGDTRMVTGVGLFTFWSNSTDPSGLPPLDGQSVPGRWLLVGGSGGNAAPWIQTKVQSWGSTMLINGDGFTTVRIPINGDSLIHMGTGTDGQKLVLELVQDSTGNHSITLGNKFKFGTDFTSITFSILPNVTDYLGLIYNAPHDEWRVVAYARGF
jgi:hypothetical protein